MSRTPGNRGGFIDSVTGQLQDFIPRPGDPAVTVRPFGTSKAQLWGSQKLISNVELLNNRGVKRVQTLVDTGDMGRPLPVDLQIRFAANLATQIGSTPTGVAIFTDNPLVVAPNLVPFVYPLPGAAASQIEITIRRGVDPTAAPTVDVYRLGPDDVLPVDIITTRMLQVNAEALGGVFPDQTVWCEAIATPVHEIGEKNKVQPWDKVGRNPAFFLTTTAAGAAFLPANSDRSQFFIVNTSTDADLILQFGKGPDGLGPVWPTRGTVILPRGGFATYESPCPAGFKGTVFATWSNVGTGGATVFEGTVF